MEWVGEKNKFPNEARCHNFCFLFIWTSTGTRHETVKTAAYTKTWDRVLSCTSIFSTCCMSIEFSWVHRPHSASLRFCWPQPKIAKRSDTFVTSLSCKVKVRHLLQQHHTVTLGLADGGWAVGWMGHQHSSHLDW